MTEWKIHRKHKNPYWCFRCEKDGMTKEELDTHKCLTMFHPLDELERHAMNDRRAAQKEIDDDFQDFRREHI